MNSQKNSSLNRYNCNSSLPIHKSPGRCLRAPIPRSTLCCLGWMDLLRFFVWEQKYRDATLTESTIPHFACKNELKVAWFFQVERTFAFSQSRESRGGEKSGAKPGKRARPKFSRLLRSWQRQTLIENSGFEVGISFDAMLGFFCVCIRREETFCPKHLTCLFNGPIVNLQKHWPNFDTYAFHI